jgi:hypothetical protein
MKNFWMLLPLALCLPRPANAYIPPVREIVENVFEGRKPQPGLEISLTHRVQIPGGAQVVVDERIVSEGSSVSVLWKTQGVAVGAQWERQSYVVNSQAALPSRSSIFMKYLLGHSPEDFTRQLLNEQFIHREQLVTFNPGYTPKGEPSTWKTRTFYKAHDDVFFSRLPGGVAVAVVGLDEGSVRKAVYFDDDFKGVARLEWREGAGSTTWDFGGFSKFPGAAGFFPKRMTFTYQGAERVTTSVASVRVLKGNSLADFRKTLQAARAGGVSPTAEPALKLLLGYR